MELVFVAILTAAEVAVEAELAVSSEGAQKIELVSHVLAAKKQSGVFLGPW